MHRRNKLNERHCQHGVISNFVERLQTFLFALAYHKPTLSTAQNATGRQAAVATAAAIVAWLGIFSWTYTATCNMSEINKCIF